MPQTPGVADHAGEPAAADARQRATRTFIQGLLIDVLLAAALVVYDALQAADVDWRLLALSLLKTALTTVASYVMRKVAPPT